MLSTIHLGDLKKSQCLHLIVTMNLIPLLEIYELDNPDLSDS